MLDIKIRGGTLLDGSGAPRFRADIGIRDGVIAAIGPEINEDASETIDAEGLFVTPGFLDTHAHSDDAVFFPNDGYNYLEQGITTQLVGNCGDSPAPYREGCGVLPTDKSCSDERMKEIMCEAKDGASFLAAADRQRLGTNYAFLIGHNALRRTVMGDSDARPTQQQLREMQEHIRIAMRAGYFGYSSGLVYAPSAYADTDELVELAKAAAELGGIYATHIRSEGDHVLSAVQEAIEVGHRSGASVLLSHVKVMGPNNEGKAQEILRRIHAANRSGDHVFADMYPFEAGSAPLISQIPPKYLNQGRETLLGQLKDEAFRRRVEYSIFHETEEFEGCLYYSGYEGASICIAPETPQYVGRTIAEIAAAEGKEPRDVMADILLRNNGNVQGIYICAHMEDILTFLADPVVYAGTDWSVYPEHFAEDRIGGGHPRGTGAMLRRIALCRSKGLRTPEECIYSMSGGPAAAIGLRGRGLLKEGYAADICVLDYENADTGADHLHPFRRNRGLHYVLLNGVVVVRQGRAEGKFAGRVIRHEHP